MVIGTAVSGDFVRDEGVTGFAREAGHGTEDSRLRTSN
jgi:hypothetical protein